MCISLMFMLKVLVHTLPEPLLYSLTGIQAELRGAQESILEEARCELEG